MITLVAAPPEIFCLPLLHHQPVVTSIMAVAPDADPVAVPTPVAALLHSLDAALPPPQMDAPASLVNLAGQRNLLNNLT